MFRLSLASLAFVASIAAAAPGNGLDARAACNRDNCLRAVVASHAAPGPAQGSADCASFFLTTLTPCATTVTATGPAQTMTITVQSTSTATFVDSETSTSTITTTVTSTTTVATVTTTPGATVTTTPPPARKRTLNALERRVTTCPVASGPTGVPAYASACSGTVRYSSACSCNGLSASTMTLAQQTSTMTVTPTSTATVTNANTVTVTSTSQTTVSTTTTVTTTVSATATMYPFVLPFYLTEDGTNYQVAYDRDNNLRLIRTSTGSGADFNLDTSGHLNSFSSYAAVALTGDDEILLVSGDQGSHDLQCACANYVGRTGGFTCSASNGESQFVVCAGGVYHLTFAGSVPSGCSVVTFTCHKFSG